MNATNPLDYIIINIVGVEQSIARGWVPTRYLVWLSGPNAGTSVPLDKDGP